MMEPVIVLTKEAVDAMFPPGTEARVRLADAAVKALLTETVTAKTISDETSQWLRTAKDAVVAEVLAEYGTNTLKVGRNFVLNEKTRDAIQAQVREKFDTMMYESIGHYMGRLTHPQTEHLVYAEMQRTIRRIATEEAEKSQKAFLSRLGELTRNPR